MLQSISLIQTACLSFSLRRLLGQPEAYHMVRSSNVAKGLRWEDLGFSQYQPAQTSSPPLFSAWSVPEVRVARKIPVTCIQTRCNS